MYTYDSISHCAPGYRFQYLVLLAKDLHEGLATVPCSAKIAAFLEDAEVLDPCLLKSNCNELCAVSTANNHNIDFLINRITLDDLAEVRIFNIVRQTSFDHAVLIYAFFVGLKTLVSFCEVFVLESNWVKGSFEAGTSAPASRVTGSALTSIVVVSGPGLSCSGVGSSVTPASATVAILGSRWYEVINISTALQAKWSVWV